MPHAGGGGTTVNIETQTQNKTKESHHSEVSNVNLRTVTKGNAPLFHFQLTMSLGWVRGKSWCRA